MKYDYIIVGAGFAGCVLAERLASQLNKKILIIDRRAHIGGNSYDEYDEYGILVHRYGPHIFHTNSRKVFEYLSMFTSWRSYEHRVLAHLNGDCYPIPINRLTVNKLYGLHLATDEEVEQYYASVREPRTECLTSEDVIVSQVGYDLFEKFFKAYTLKQWSMEPRQLSPSVCGRIPVRTNEDCRYFSDVFQYMPGNGYTSMFGRMLKYPNIETLLSTDYRSIIADLKFDKLIFTGPIDEYFDCCFGKLPYRSLRFEFEHHERDDYQEAAQVNFVGSDVDYTRVVEFKKITGQQASTTTICREYAVPNGEPFYPIPTPENKRIFRQYQLEAARLRSVVFAGRLAEYQYYNMDQVVANSLMIFGNLSKGYK
jgi:UDP-galactopyranose mutase